MPKITHKVMAAASLMAASLLGVVAAPAPASAASGSGYLMVSADGHVYRFGSAPFCGHSDMVFSRRATDVEVTPNGQGYWILIDGGYVDFKDCGMSSSDYLKYEHNNIASLQTGEKAVSLSVLPDGSGYWVFTDRGRAIAFGNAQFFGDMAGKPLNGAVLGSVASPKGNGYWMVASDGGIFSFGDAKFSGSTGDMKLNKPVMSMAPDPDGRGYWLVASDGGIFAFDAQFKGSMGATRLNKPISGMVPGADGYMMVAEDGGIFSFGNVAFHGSLGATPPSSPITAVALWSSDPTFGVAQPDRPAPVMGWREVYPAKAGQGSFSTLPFTVTGTKVDVLHSCDPDGANPHVSCWFELKNFDTGQSIDMWNLAATSYGDVRHQFFDVKPGRYYLEADPSSNDYIWAFAVMEHVCVENCS